MADNNTNDTTKVFISYSKTSIDFLALLNSHLTKANISVWIDKEKLATGKDWRNEIDDAIIASDVLVLILDKNSAKSEYVTYEWAFALGNGIPIIPLLLEDCEKHPRINVLQHLDFTNDNRPWEKLIHEIKSKPNKKEKIAEVTDATTTAAPLLNNPSRSESNIEKPKTILCLYDTPKNVGLVIKRELFEYIGFKLEYASSKISPRSTFDKNKHIAVIYAI